MTSEPQPNQERHMRSSNPGRASLTDLEIAYVRRFSTSMTARLKRRGIDDADDISQAEVLKLIQRVHEISKRYPDAAVYAQVRLRHATIEYRRRDNSQRGMGSRPSRNSAAAEPQYRVVLSGDAPLNNGTEEVTLFDSIRYSLEGFENHVVDAMASKARLSEVFSMVDCVGRTLLTNTFLLEQSDSEVARSMGCARETLNRKKQQLIRTIRGSLSDQDV